MKKLLLIALSFGIIINVGCRQDPEITQTESSSMAVSSKTAASESSSASIQPGSSQNPDILSESSEPQSVAESSSTSSSTSSSDGRSEQWLSNYAKYIEPILHKSEGFVASKFDRFITRTGNKLYDGIREFRFVSVNAANLLYNCDDTAIVVSTENRRRSSPFEIADTLESVAQMGGQVVRSQTFSIRQPSSARAIIKHIYAPGKYDELLFRDLDRIFAECNRYGIRLILPIINPWPFIGSGADFDVVCGGPGTLHSFYTNANTIAKYKEFLIYLVNRTNYYTGVKYKNEKALLCWELGNEITASSIIEPDRAPASWMCDIAQFIKSIDPNHLIMDGGVTNPDQAIIESDYIDILTTHYSPALSVPDKPTIAGEFDPTNGLNQTFIDYYLSKSIGMMAWNLDPHNKNGGFLYRQQDWKTPPLRWPGFVTGMPNEAIQMALLRKNAFAVQGIAVPAIKAPAAPELLPIGVAASIRWRGSAGADSYDIQRADNPDGPYSTIASNIDDSQIPRFVPYSDKTAEEDRIYYYRIIAKNRGGKSSPSNVVPCMPEILYADMEEESYGNQRIDELNSFGNIFSHSGEINISTGIFGDASALTFNSSSEIIYKMNGLIKDFFIFIQWKNNSYKNIKILLSKDGKTYTGVTADLINYGQSDYFFGRLEKFPIKGEYKYLKIQVTYQEGLENSLYISRTELNYD